MRIDKNGLNPTIPLCYYCGKEKKSNCTYRSCRIEMGKEKWYSIRRNANACMDLW